MDYYPSHDDYPKKKKRLNFSAIELLIYHLCVLINGKNNHHGADAICSNVIVTK